MAVVVMMTIMTHQKFDSVFYLLHTDSKAQWAIEDFIHLFIY
jgi:hypothetical protein